MSAETREQLAAGLRKRAKSCRDLVKHHAAVSSRARLMGKAQAYDHAAELVLAAPGKDGPS